MSTARTRKLVAVLTALLISNALASQAFATGDGLTTSPVQQQRSFKDEKLVDNTAPSGIATYYREVCVETSIRRYDPYSERIVTVDLKIVCR